MNNHYYCDYLNDDQFLKEVEKYTSKYNNDFDTIKDKISDKVSSLVYNAHGDQHDINDYIAQAKSLLNVLCEINDRLHAEVD
jgi:hypothetical protein